MSNSITNSESSSCNSTTKETKTRSWSGIIFGFLAALLTSFGSIFLKIADEHKTKVVLLRVLFQFLVLMPVVSYKKIGVITPNLKTNLLLILRGFLSPFISISLALSLTYLPLGDCTAIFYTNPALTVFFACLCLKETCTILNVALTLVTFAGFVLVAQPDFIFGAPEDEPNHFHYPYRIVGSLLALVASVMVSIAVVIIRKLGRGVHFSLSMLYAGLNGVIATLIYMGITGVSLIPCFQSLPVMFASAVAFFMGQMLRTLALQREKAGTISLIQTSQVIYSFILQYFFLGEVPTLLGGIGAGLIFLSCVALGIKGIVKAVK